VYSTENVDLYGYNHNYTTNLVVTPGRGKMADGTTDMPVAAIETKVMARVNVGTDKTITTWKANVNVSPNYELENKAIYTTYDDSVSNLGSTTVQKAIEVLDDKVDGLVTTNTKNKYNATVAPTVSDDSTEGYSVGSVWVDTTAGEVYRLVDASVDAAVWENIATKTEVVTLDTKVDSLKTVTATYVASAGQTEFLITNTTSEPMTVLYEGYPIVEGSEAEDYTRASDKITLNTAADVNEQIHIIAHNG